MKRAIRYMLITVMAITMLTINSLAAEYTDTAGHWANSAITRWSEAGVIQGYSGHFLPDHYITRSELSVVIDRMMGYTKKDDIAFPDVPVDAWYTASMLRLYSAGVLQGDGGKLRPQDNLTRQEAIVILARAFMVEPAEEKITFSDEDHIANWAKGYVSSMSQRGYIQGIESNTFSPNEPITRASVITILDRMFQGYYHEAGIYTESVAGDVLVGVSEVTLKDMDISGDLILADGVGYGDVYLDNVSVSGRIIIRGGGEHSIHLYLKDGVPPPHSVIICKTSDGKVRLVNENGNRLPTVNIADNKSGVVLSGSFEHVVVNCATSIELDSTVGKSEIQSISLNSEDSELTVGSQVKIEQLHAAGNDCIIKIAPSAIVSTVTAAAQVKIENEGTIKNVNVYADNIILDGMNQNTKIVIANTVSSMPKDSDGNVVGAPSGGGSSSGGGDIGGGGGGGVTPPPKVENISSILILLKEPQAAKIAESASSAGAGYSLTTLWKPALDEDYTFKKGTIYTAQITVTPATGYEWNLTTLSEIPIKLNGAVTDKTSINLPQSSTASLSIEYAFPATAQTLEIVPDLLPQGIYTKEGMVSQSLSISAHVESDGQMTYVYPLSCRWELQGYTGWETVGTELSFSLPASLMDGSYIYRCVLEADGCTPFISDNVVVTVEPKPDDATIEAPRNLTLCYGVDSSQTTPPSIRWTPPENNSNVERYWVQAYCQGVVMEDSWNTVGQDLRIDMFCRNLTEDCVIDRLSVTSRGPNYIVGNTETMECHIEVNVGNAKLPASAAMHYDDEKRLFWLDGLEPDRYYYLSWGMAGVGDYANSNGMIFRTNMNDYENDDLLADGAKITVYIIDSSQVADNSASFTISTTELPVIIDEYKASNI